MKVTEIIGLYGAALSSVVAFRQWRAAHPKLTLTTVPAYNGQGFEPVGQFIRVNVSNRGATKAYLRSAFVQLLLEPQTFGDRLRYWRGSISPWHGGGRQLVRLPAETIIAPDLPATLEPGQSLVVWVPLDAHRALWDGPRVRGVRIVVQDQGDRSYSSKSYRH